jgi:hypothetical protein
MPQVNKNNMWNKSASRLTSKNIGGGCYQAGNYQNKNTVATTFFDNYWMEFTVKLIILRKVLNWPKKTM